MDHSNKNCCRCGESIDHKRVGLCSLCYKEKRRVDWQFNEITRLTSDPDRKSNKLKHASKRYYEKYREKRLIRKMCACGNAAVRGSRYSLCIGCSKVHRSKSKIEYQSKRKKSHLPTKIRERIKSRLRDALSRRKSLSIVEYLGCSIEDYILYIELKFQCNMTWDNYGKEWHIDHIIPLSTDYSDTSLHNFKNTQPLWIKDHVRKTAQENGLSLPKTVK